MQILYQAQCRSVVFASRKIFQTALSYRTQKKCTSDINYTQYIDGGIGIAPPNVGGLLPIFTSDLTNIRPNYLQIWAVGHQHLTPPIKIVLTACSFFALAPNNISQLYLQYIIDMVYINGSLCLYILYRDTVYHLIGIISL